MSTDALKINEIFYSLQGESLLVGKPTVFVRTTGCNLRCVWCDTKYAFYEGNSRTIPEILSEVRKYESHYVCVTGGEPLAQPATLTLLQALVKENYTVSLETSGSLSVRDVPEPVIRIIDIKCPDSYELEKMHWENLELVSPHDQFKFVLASRRDFDWARNLCAERQLSKKCAVLYSPVFGKVTPKELAEWILEARLSDVTMQLQMHKAIWGPTQRGV